MGRKSPSDGKRHSGGERHRTSASPPSSTSPAFYPATARQGPAPGFEPTRRSMVVPEASRMTHSPFTSVGMPATPDVQHSLSSSSPRMRSREQAVGGAWEGKDGGASSSSSRRPDHHHRSPPRTAVPAVLASASTGTTVNVAMPNRRTSRADQTQPSSFIVGPSDRGASQGASASISTTPGYGLLSLSTTTSTAGAGASSSAIAGGSTANSPLGAATTSTADGTSSSRPWPTGEGDKRSKPSLQGFSRSRNGCKYRLVVVQHPTRARMCGFGDKDRRPLSPTLIVKLVITDEKTGEEVSPWKVNTSLFFLASDLCHPDDLMFSPRNVLVHQHAASIPTAMLQQQGQGQDRQALQGSHPASPYSTHSSRPPTASSSSLPPLGGLYLGDRSRGGGNDGGGIAMHSQQTNDEYPPRTPPHLAAPTSSPLSSAALTTVTTEHYTRNLVGAAVTSANVLKDEQDNYAIFFILQDLSVRTEGVYRIRLMFTDLAHHDGQTNESVSDALAETYTEPFSVYSPRRFPGMLEPTELSKKLASQGIKIAVRSDKKKRRRDSDGGQGPGGEVDELEEDDE